MKGSNCLLEHHVVKLADFGSAAKMAFMTQRTADGGSVGSTGMSGTAFFMAPEAAHGPSRRAHVPPG